MYLTRTQEKKSKQGCGVFAVLYENTYKEMRVLVIDANNDSECEDIIKARGIKPLAYFEFSELIRLFNKKGRKNDKTKSNNAK